jgi:uncharacterized protein (TIGR03000 family)
LLHGFNAPANITISLPADAVLWIDDRLTASTSAQRQFITPALPAGKDFHYTLKAEIVRDGQKLTASERVTVRAGAETRTRFTLPDSRFAATNVAAR